MRTATQGQERGVQRPPLDKLDGHVKPGQFEAEHKLEDTVNNKTRLFYQLT